MLLKNNLFFKLKILKEFTQILSLIKEINYWFSMSEDPFYHTLAHLFLVTWLFEVETNRSFEAAISLTTPPPPPCLGERRNILYMRSRREVGICHLLPPVCPPSPFTLYRVCPVRVYRIMAYTTVIGFNTLISWSYDKFNNLTDSRAFLRCCLFIPDTEMPSNFKKYCLTCALNPANILLAMLFLQTPCRVSRDFGIVIGETRTVVDVSWKRSIAICRIILIYLRLP